MVGRAILLCIETFVPILNLLGFVCQALLLEIVIFNACFYMTDVISLIALHKPPP